MVLDKMLGLIIKIYDIVIKLVILVIILVWKLVWSCLNWKNLVIGFLFNVEFDLFVEIIFFDLFIFLVILIS